MEDILKNIIAKLPYWFKARHEDNSSSTTYKFLSVFGNSVYELEKCIEYAFNSTKLKNMDTKDYVVRKIILDTPIDITEVKVNKVIANKVSNDHMLLTTSYISYLYDSDRGIIYIANCNETDSIYINSVKYNHNSHRVWKADMLDEFGLIYSLPRLENENNKSYKDRLLEYSKTISNSSWHGMSNALGHSLGTYHITTWNNGAESISISDSDIICRHVYVDDIPYISANKINTNTISLQGDKNYNGVSRKIKYFTGFDFYPLEEINMSSKEYDDIFKKISLQCPIMWGIARWNEIEFLDNNVDDYYYIAPTFDPDLSVLKR